MGALVDGKSVKVGDVGERTWRIVASGPVRSIAEIHYTGWKVAGRSIDLVSRFTQWAGERGFEHDVTMKGGEGIVLVTSIPHHAGCDPWQASVDTVLGVGAWGPQVLSPGATSVVDLPNEQLGLAVVVPGGSRGATEATRSSPSLSRTATRAGS